MRTFVVKRGKFEGEHKIYDNAEELKKDIGVSFIRKPWSSPETKDGDWCYMDDGFIMQCLKHSKLTSKKTGKSVETFRFPVGSRAVYYRKRDNSRVAPCLYTTNPSANKSALVSQGYDRAIGGTYDSRKKLWVNLVAEGLDPYEATLTVYHVYAHNPNKILSLTSKLIEDSKIRSHLMAALVPFKNELENKIKEVTGGNTLNESIALSFAKLIATDPKSVKELTIKINTLLNVAKITGDIVPYNPGKKINNVEEVQFKEMTPPILGETKNE